MTVLPPVLNASKNRRFALVALLECYSQGQLAFMRAQINTIITTL